MIRLLIAAPASGGGKTTVMCALLRALKNRGVDPCAFKCGPDYIDPMFHRAILGVESSTSTPKRVLSFETITSRWILPAPEMTI